MSDLTITREDAEKIRFELKNFMKRVLDIGQTSLSNNKQYSAFRKLIFDEYHCHNEKISELLDLPINESTK